MTPILVFCIVEPAEDELIQKGTAALLSRPGVMNVSYVNDVLTI